MKTTNFVCTQIEWDTDGDKTAFAELPQRIMVSVPNHIAKDEDDLQEHLSDALSDLTGWCHFGFTFAKE